MSGKIYPTKWLPKDKEVIRKFIESMKEKCLNDPDENALLEIIQKFHPPIDSPEKAGSDLQPHVSMDEIRKLRMHPPVKDLYIKILTDPEINMFFHQMFTQQNQQHAVIESWQVFIALLNVCMTITPVFSDSGLVGFPINALINWPMSTTAGFACFLNDKVNALFKNILNYWGEHLQSPKSTSVLNQAEGGWFSPAALKKMEDASGHTFEQQFICDPSKPHWGFTSWDHFFTRQFKPGMRPLTQPDDPSIIANACEAAPFKIERNVNARSKFWIKEQPYSLSHMLNNSDWTHYFLGGTVYQGFLSATSYHRWHSPVSGTIVNVDLIEGSYYSQTYEIQDDASSPNESQGYISQVAARAAIYIKADNPLIGFICFLSIGMSEVSSNEATVKVGQYVKKGEELGMFHFGGSTHYLIFRPGLGVDFEISPNTHVGLDAQNIPLKRRIATVKSVQNPEKEGKTEDDHQKCNDSKEDIKQ